MKTDTHGGHAADPFSVFPAWNVDGTWRRGGHLATMINHENESHTFTIAEQKVGKNLGPSWHHRVITLLALAAWISSRRR